MAADRKRPVVFQLDIQSQMHLFSIFFDTQGPLMVDILPQKSRLTATHCVETVLPEMIKSIYQQRQIVVTGKTLLLHANASAHKAKVTVTLLKE